MNTPLKAVIFDRDSTLNRTTQILRPGQSPGDPTDGYVLARHEFELLPAARPALARLRQIGIRPFVFTQQNCIGKGLITEDGARDIHAHMNELLGHGAHIEAFYLAWNTPGQTDSPRAKPSPEMIFEILRDHRLEKHEVLVAGDSMRDCKAAVAAGVDFAWIIDDLKRTSMETMRETGFPVFGDVLELVDGYILPEK